jgi:hypothetical protein
MLLSALGLKGHWAALKAGPRRTMRIHARHALVTGTAAHLARLLRALNAYCGKGSHAAAGAWAEGPQAA